MRKSQHEEKAAVNKAPKKKAVASKAAAQRISTKKVPDYRTIVVRELVSGALDSKANSRERKTPSKVIAALNKARAAKDYSFEEIFPHSDLMASVAEMTHETEANHKEIARLREETTTRMAQVRAILSTL